MGTNIMLPDKTQGLPTETLHAFAVIIVILLIITAGLVLVIRYWRWNARKKWTVKRDADLPSTWDGFWGFR
jgi:uncharacterized membrane protein YidH (DUF202 family)